MLMHGYLCKVPSHTVCVHACVHVSCVLLPPPPIFSLVSNPGAEGCSPVPSIGYHVIRVSSWSFYTGYRVLWLAVALVRILGSIETGCVGMHMLCVWKAPLSSSIVLHGAISCIIPVFLASACTFVRCWDSGLGQHRKQSSCNSGPRIPLMRPNRSPYDKCRDVSAGVPKHKSSLSLIWC